MLPMIGSVIASQIFPTIGMVPARAVGMPSAFVRNTAKKELMMTKHPPPKNSPIPYTTLLKKP